MEASIKLFCRANLENDTISNTQGSLHQGIHPFMFPEFKHSIDRLQRGIILCSFIDKYTYMHTYAQGDVQNQRNGSE